jgi:putative ABC transport system permease protein
VAVWAPFIIAFGVIALVVSVLIIANVVSGAVIAGTTRIGVLQAIGFTPAQVTGSYVLQVAVPALAGCVVGAVLGVLLAIPILSQNASVYGVGSLSTPPWVELAVPAARRAWVPLAPTARQGALGAPRGEDRAGGAVLPAGRPARRPLSSGRSPPRWPPTRRSRTGCRRPTRRWAWPGCPSKCR